MNPEFQKAVSKLSKENAPDFSLSPSPTRREPVEHALHGGRRVDHYTWLRNKDNPEVLAYLEAENAYTRAVSPPDSESAALTCKFAMAFAKIFDLRFLN